MKEFKCKTCGSKWNSKQMGNTVFCSRKCYSEYQKTLRMDKHRNWKGGRVVMVGYYWIKQKDGRYRKEHILNMEKKLGRRLFSNEVVHHINHDKLDNQIENLRLMTKAEHHKLHTVELHKKNHWKVKKVAQIKDGKVIKIWKTQIEACKNLGINRSNLNSALLKRNTKKGRKTAGGFEWKFIE